MSEVVRESLSALMDGEADDVALQRVLVNLEKEGVRDSWRRYHLVRDAVRGESGFASIDISSAVRSAVAAESISVTRRTGSALRSLTSFAVAASVTAVIVLGGSQFAEFGDRGLATAPRAPVAAVTTLGAAPVRASFGGATGTQQATQAPAANAYQDLALERLFQLSQEHAEHAARNTPQGMIPFARVPDAER